MNMSDMIITKKVSKGKSENQAKPKRNKKQANQLSQKQVRVQSLLEDLTMLKQQYKNELSSAQNAVKAFKAGTLEKPIREINEAYPVKGKLKLLERLVGDKFVKSLYGDGFDHLSNSQMIDLFSTVYADDIFSMFGTSPTALLMSLAKEYGPQLLRWAYSTAKNKLGQFVNKKSHGSGMGVVSFPLDQEDGYVPSGYSYSDKVNMAYIRQFFAPQKYKSPMPDSFGPNCNTCSITAEYLLTTDAAGNALFYCYPDNICGSGAVDVSNFFVAQNSIAPSAANPVTGLITAPTYRPGPATPVAGTGVDKYRVLSFAMRVVPQLAAINNQGSIMLAYTTNASEPVGLPQVPQTTALQYPFVHIAAINGTKELRQLHVPHSIQDTHFDDALQNLTQLSAAGSVQDLYVLNCIGGPANTNVARVYVTVNFDWIPSEAQMLLNKPSPTPDAPGTLSCLSSLVKRFPHLTQLSEEEADSVVESLGGRQESGIIDVINALTSSGQRFKARPRHIIGEAQPNGLDQMSFDNILASS